MSYGKPNQRVSITNRPQGRENALGADVQGGTGKGDEQKAAARDGAAEEGWGGGIGEGMRRRRQREK